jgi:hypothetical protein
MRVVHRRCTMVEILIVLVVLIAVGWIIAWVCERSPGVGPMPQVRLKGPAEKLVSTPRGTQRVPAIEIIEEPAPRELSPEETEELAPLEIPPSFPALGLRPRAPSFLGSSSSGWSPPGRLTRRLQRRPRRRPMPGLEGE